jgi:hypothetical protein
MTLDDFSNNMFMRMAVMFDSAANWARKKIIVREPKHLNSHNDSDY